MTGRLLHGFGNEHESEALPGALPEGRFSPQRPPFGLYAEQLSSTAFTAPRAKNRRTWFYRIRPSVRHGAFKPTGNGGWATAPLSDSRRRRNRCAGAHQSFPSSRPISSMA